MVISISEIGSRREDAGFVVVEYYDGDRCCVQPCS